MCGDRPAERMPTEVWRSREGTVLGAMVDLVRRVRSGDTDAFSTLYRENVGAVMVAVRDNVHDAETVADVTQEVFARALERLGTLRDAERFRPWLLSIARHAAIDHRRSLSRAPESFEDMSSEPVDAGAGPDELAELDELAGFVQGGIARLSVRDATALTLATQFGLTPAEIAPTLQVSAGAAKVILCRARRRLRDELTLQLMVRRNALGCPELAVALDLGDIVAAACHVRGCLVCSAMAEADVATYAVG